MIIDFSVANYRSIYKKQTLSLVADTSKEHQETNTFQSSISKFRLLSSAAIYGANAAGKSNVLQALGAMRHIVLNSAKGNENEPIEDIEPHKLFLDEPTEFEINFIVEGIRYQYGFTATRERVLEEWLFAFPKGARSQHWLSREYNKETQEYKWHLNSDKLKGSRDVWKKATKNNALFISTAAQLNSEQLKPLVEWFRVNLRGGKLEQITPNNTYRLLENNQNKHVLNFLHNADLAIKDIDFNVREILSIDDLPDELPSEIKNDLFKVLVKDGDRPKSIHVKLSHETNEGKAFSLPLQEESEGTQQLFNYAGVWLKVLEEGHTICVDEIDSSLHPSIVRFLISLFHNPEINTKYAQLIFTTHDISILDNDFLRRDQVWFAEKNNQQETMLYPLSDFSPRKNEALQKGYLQGRYGALPFIGNPNWLK